MSSRLIFPFLTATFALAGNLFGWTEINARPVVAEQVSNSFLPSLTAASFMGFLLFVAFLNGRSRRQRDL